MSEKVSLTNRTVAALKPAEKRYGVRDKVVPGLVVMVATAGTKSFFHYSKQNGRPVRQFLGSFPAVTVEQARKNAKVYAGDVAAGRSTASKGKSGRATLAELFAHYLIVHAKPKKR